MTRELENTSIMKNRPLRGPCGSGWRAIYSGLATGGPGKQMKWKCSKQRPWRGRRIRVRVRVPLPGRDLQLGLGLGLRLQLGLGLGGEASQIGAGLRLA